MAADPITASTIENLLDFEISDAEDPFADNNKITNTRDDKPTLSPRAAKRQLEEDKENLGLGLDEEVKIVKKRKPVVKLDEARLLSETGIPKLRALARSGKIAKKLGFKGKGHEFSDVARLLNYYQLWLDGLYPRAKFADGLQLIEKVGHGRRMNVMRKEWLDEGRPGYIKRFDYDDKENRPAEELERVNQQSSTANTNQAQADDSPGDLFFRGAGAAEQVRDNRVLEEDELDALIAEQEASGQPAEQIPHDQSEGEDDLDALLAARESRPSNQPAQTNMQAEQDEDDLDALMAEYENYKPAEIEKNMVKRATIFDEDSEDDENALKAEQDTEHSITTGPELPPAQTTAAEKPEQDSNILSSSPIPNNPEEEDNLEAILAEHEASKAAGSGET